MNIDDIIRLPDPRKTVKVSAREIVRDVEERPTLFVRVRLEGWHFPERAPLPFMVVGEQVSQFVLLSAEGAVADGYFDQLPPAGRVSFGYGQVVSWDFPASFNPKTVKRLDRERLPRGIRDLRR